MILYCDTSTLVKLYVEEECSAVVRGWVEKADMVATCRVALPEMFSAFTRRLNCGDLDPDAYRRLLAAVGADWAHVVVLDFDERQAADLVERHALRGFDAVHLSAALRLAAREQVDLLFSAFDERLNRAAGAEGLRVATAQLL
jgi:predicted nucleic acid-binding protein